MDDCVIIVNGEEYVKKRSSIDTDIFIVRTYSAGVFMGR
jgi:hypothetical protein